MEVGKAVDQAVEAVRPLIDARGHELTVSLPAEPLWLEADPVRLEQILANLLTNAARYTEPGGRIALEAGREADHLVLRVRDNGIGIAPEVLPRIFGLFAQADTGADRSGRAWASGSRWSGAWWSCTAGACRPPAPGRAGGASSSSACPSSSRPEEAGRRGGGDGTIPGPRADVRHRGACSSWTTRRTRHGAWPGS